MNIGNLHIKERDYHLLRRYLEHGIPILLEGPPGVGKSLAAREIGRQVYAELAATRCPSGVDRATWPEPLKIDITEDTEVRHLLGELDYLKLHNYSQSLASQPSSEAPEVLAAHVERFRRTRCFMAGPLTMAATQGRLLIIEELDRAGRDTLFSALFDPIEKKTLYVPELGREISGHPDGRFNIIITVNRATDVGTIRLPGALLRRLRRVVLYDPASDRDDPEGAIAHEREIILANVDALTRNGGLAGADDHRAALTTRIDAVLRDFVRPLRMAELDAGAIQPSISPSETVSWVLDVLRFEGLDAFCTADRDTVHHWLLRFGGAIAKDGEAAERLEALLRRIESDSTQAARRQTDERRTRLQRGRDRLQTELYAFDDQCKRSQDLEAGDVPAHCRLVAEAAERFVRFIDDDLLPDLANELGLTTYSRQTDLPRFPKDAHTARAITSYTARLYAAVDAFQKAELQPGGTLDEAAAAASPAAAGW